MHKFFGLNIKLAFQILTVNCGHDKLSWQPHAGVFDGMWELEVTMTRLAEVAQRPRGQSAHRKRALGSFTIVRTKEKIMLTRTNEKVNLHRVTVTIKAGQ